MLIAEKVLESIDIFSQIRVIPHISIIEFMNFENEIEI